MKKELVEWLSTLSFMARSLLVMAVMLTLMEISFTMLKVIFCWRSGISVALIGDVANAYASRFSLIGCFVCVITVPFLQMLKYRDFSVAFDKRTIWQFRTGLLATAVLVLFLSVTTLCRLAFGVGFFDEAQFVRWAEICFCLNHLALGGMHYGYLAGGLSYINDLIDEVKKAKRESEAEV